MDKCLDEVEMEAIKNPAVCPIFCAPILNVVVLISSTENDVITREVRVLNVIF